MKSTLRVVLKFSRCMSRESSASECTDMVRCCRTAVVSKSRARIEPAFEEQIVASFYARAEPWTTDLEGSLRRLYVPITSSTIVPVCSNILPEWKLTETMSYLSPYRVRRLQFVNKSVDSLAFQRSIPVQMQYAMAPRKMATPMAMVCSKKRPAPSQAPD